MLHAQGYTLTRGAGRDGPGHDTSSRSTTLSPFDSVKQPWLIGSFRGWHSSRLVEIGDGLVARLAVRVGVFNQVVVARAEEALDKLLA